MPLAQMITLGITFVVMAVMTDSAYALAAARIASAARRHARFTRAGGYLSGAVYIGLGVATAAQAPTK